MKYEHIIPLGDHCATAMILKHRGFRKCSYPFDYISSNLYKNMELIIELINNKLDVEKFVTLHKNPTNTNINDYDFEFPHEPITDKIQLMEKYGRRFNRLRDHIVTGTAILVMINRFDKIDAEKVISFVKIFKDNNINISFLLLHGDLTFVKPDCPTFYHKYIQYLPENFYRYDYTHYRPFVDKLFRHIFADNNKQLDQLLDDVTENK